MIKGRIIWKDIFFGGGGGGGGWGLVVGKNKRKLQGKMSQKKFMQSKTQSGAGYPQPELKKRWQI